MPSMPINSNSLRFQGVWADVLIPLQENLDIDDSKLSAHLRNLCANGIEQFLLFGQAGEGASFSSDEKLATLSHVLTSGVEAKAILLGVQSCSFTDVAQLIRKAYDKGVRRFLVSPPLYGQPFNHMALFDYMDQLIKHVNLPDWQLFLHQLGGLSHSADLPEITLADLRKAHPHVFAGVVDQDVHVNHTVDLIRSFGSEIAIASAHEPNFSILKPTMCVSAMANILPHSIKRLLANEAVNNATKIPGMKVARPDDRVVELFTLIGDRPFIASMKLLLSIHYRMESWERVRPPQSRLTKEVKQSLLSAFKTFNLQAHE